MKSFVLLFCILALGGDLFAGIESYDSTHSYTYDSTQLEDSISKLRFDYTNSKFIKGKSGLSIFYSVSTGTLTETSTSAIVGLSQNSPYTIGLSFFKEFNYNASISSSIYILKFAATVTEQDGTLVEVGVPMEYGFTGYFNYKFDTRYILPTLYTGIDIEQFSSFNTDKLADLEPLSTRVNRLLYMTLGISHRFLLFNKKAVIKVSVSKSISSSQSSASIDNPLPFSGSKALLYLNLQLLKQWSVHTLLKRHNLTGATNLVITRMGFGVGYSF